MKVYVLISNYNSPDQTNDFAVEGVFQSRQEALENMKEEYMNLLNEKDSRWRIEQAEDGYILLVSDNGLRYPDFSYEIYVNEYQLR